ncbi:hypothetical protein HN865_04565 [Candidatus Woesearchaeota archaeon]|jgi:hypothetical protein|nr:hypothetical protein [Candidatus Woesearchaeota archaeon]MBT7238099.1 hypothetical protein [Candidatus Woesearchaeota archaeon]
MKLKRSIKQKARDLTIGTLGTLVAAIPSFGQPSETNMHVTGDVKTDQGVVTTRTSLATGPITYNMFRASGDNTVDTGHLLTFTKPIFGEETPSTLWMRSANSHENNERTDSKTQIGLDISLPNGEKNSHYILPAWLTFDERGRLKESDIIALGNNDLGIIGAENIDIIYGLIKCINIGEDDASAFYVGPKGKNLSGIFGMDYDGVWRTDVGFKAGDIGGLVDFKRNTQDKDSRLKIMVAQNPGAVTNVTGPGLTGDIFVLDAYPTEQNPYLSAIQDKSNGGASAELNLGDRDGIIYGSALAGYKLRIPGGNIAASAGLDMCEGRDTQKMLNVSAKTLGDKLFMEYLAKEGQSPKFFARVNGLNF